MKRNWKLPSFQDFERFRGDISKCGKNYENVDEVIFDSFCSWYKMWGIAESLIDIRRISFKHTGLTPVGNSKNIPLFRYRLRSHDWFKRVINYCKWKSRPECSNWMRNIFLSVNDVGVIIKTNFGKHHWMVVCSYGS